MAQVLNTGWINGSSMTTAAYGTIGWYELASLLDDPDPECRVGQGKASWTVTTIGTSSYAVIKDLVGAVPLNTVILGIEVRHRGGSLPPINNYEKSVKLYVDGSIAGSEKTGNYNFVGCSESNPYVVRGGPTDLWGLTLTPEQVNASTFGYGLSLETVATNYQAGVMHQQMKIYYKLKNLLFLTL